MAIRRGQDTADLPAQLCADPAAGQPIHVRKSLAGYVNASRIHRAGCAIEAVRLRVWMRRFVAAFLRRFLSAGCRRRSACGRSHQGSGHGRGHIESGNGGHRRLAGHRARGRGAAAGTLLRRDAVPVRPDLGPGRRRRTGRPLRCNAHSHSRARSRGNRQTEGSGI